MSLLKHKRDVTITPPPKKKLLRSKNLDVFTWETLHINKEVDPLTHIPSTAKQTHHHQKTKKKGRGTEEQEETQTETQRQTESNKEGQKRAALTRKNDNKQETTTTTTTR